MSAPSSAPIHGGNYAKRPQSYPSRMPGTVPQSIRGQGGSWGTMFASMGIVTAGLLGFYYAQFTIQGKRTPSTVKNLTEIPTWQLRHAQQQPGLVQELSKDVEDSYTRVTPNFEPKAGDGLPLPGRDIHARPVVSTVLSFLHGKGSADNDDNPRRIPQPAMTRRQQGHMYTKNSDYVTGFKPTHKID